VIWCRCQYGRVTAPVCVELEWWANAHWTTIARWKRSIGEVKAHGVFDIVEGGVDAPGSVAGAVAGKYPGHGEFEEFAVDLGAVRERRGGFFFRRKCGGYWCGM